MIVFSLEFLLFLSEKSIAFFTDLVLQYVEEQDLTMKFELATLSFFNPWALHNFILPLHFCIKHHCWGFPPGNFGVEMVNAIVPILKFPELLIEVQLVNTNFNQTSDQCSVFG